MNNLTELHSSRTNFASSATRWAFRTPVFIALTLTAFTFANSAAAQVSGKVDFGATKVPAVQNPLTVIRSSPAAAPAAFLQDALSKMGAQTNKIAPLANSPLFADRGKNIPASTIGLIENGQLRAYWDEKSGEAEIFPLFDGKNAVTGDDSSAAVQQKVDLAARTAQQIFARADVIPHDATQFTVGAPRPVMGANATRSGDNGTVNEAPAALYLTYVAVQRKVDGLPVYGPGSNASLAMGNDGSVQGFVKRWNVGVAGGTVNETRTPDEVKSEILKQLQPLTASANVTVLSIEVAYYDDQGDTIQPVYRITAQVHYLQHAAPGVKAGKVSNDTFIVRYLPIGANVLAVAAGDAQPTVAEKPNGPFVVPPDDPTVGRYVVRNDDPGWVASANGFWSNVTSSPNGGLFSNLQYFWAYPFEFNTSELSYVNSVNVALNEVHGNWWYFTTYQDWGDGVDLTAIPAADGFGSAAGGQLNYWILHSCEVVPSAIDAPCSTDSRSWSTPWFNIFRGLHTVVGYRTIMYINDGVTSPFGLNIEKGAAVISAWFNAANSASDYSGRPTATAHCGNAPPMGRPSAVTVCGHSNDTIFNEAALPAASCLTNFWQPN
jgi:hypothetical protein